MTDAAAFVPYELPPDGARLDHVAVAGPALATPGPHVVDVVSRDLDAVLAAAERPWRPEA